MQRLYCAIAFLAAFFLVSCNTDGITDSFDASQDFTQSNIKVVQIDTFSVNMNTIRYDSIVNEGNNRLLVGQYTDPYFGVVKASAFANFVPQTYYIDQLAVFDSVVVSMEYDGYFYNDTLVQKTIQVHELTKEIRFKNGQSYFYNNSDVAAADAIIGQKTFYPRISNDSLTIRLNDAFGLNLFEKIQNNVINDGDELTDYFKGLKITPSDTENASIMGFNVSNTYIRFYYTIPDQASTDSQFIDFSYLSSDKQYFSKIEGNRSGTLLQGIAGQENEVPSSSTNNLTFIQGGIGITTKVTFPSIRDIATVNSSNGDIFKANLKIKLNKNYYTKNTYPSDSLYVYVVDQNNDFVGRLTDASGTGVTAYIDHQDAETNEVYVIAPVEAFLQKVLTDNLYLKYGLVFLPKNYNSITERLILNGENNNDYKSRLQLTYIIYDK